MAENNFLTYKGKPLVRKGKEIYYGDTSEKFIADNSKRLLSYYSIPKALTAASSGLL